MKIIMVYLVKIRNVNLWIFDSKKGEKEECRESYKSRKYGLHGDGFVCASV